MFGRDGRTAAWLLLCCAAGLACTKLPAPTRQEAIVRVDRILQDQLDQDELTQFAGTPPTVCEVSSPASRLCEWRLGRPHSGWAPLAEAIGTRDRVSLICELPSDGSPRARSSCKVYPRRSNRADFPMPTASSTPSGQPMQRKDEIRAHYKQQARQILARARTLPELVDLVGAIPDTCVRESREVRVCLWRTAARTYGHGTLAMSIGAPKDKKVRMRCRLPSDGSDRAPDSCKVEIGG